MASSHQTILGGGSRVFEQDVACGICEPNSAGAVQPMKTGPVRPDPKPTGSSFLPGQLLLSPCSFPGLTAGRR